MRRLHILNTHDVPGDVSETELRELKAEIQAAITHQAPEASFPDEDPLAKGDTNEQVARSEVQVYAMFGKLHVVVDAVYTDPPPKTRGECADVPRPCPHRTCRYHLLAGEKNSARDRVAEVVPKASCALDLADEGGLTLEEIGERLGVTRERVRQIEETAMHKLTNTPERRAALSKINDDWPEEPASVYDTLDDIFDESFQTQVNRSYERLFPKSTKSLKRKRVTLCADESFADACTAHVPAESGVLPTTQNVCGVYLARSA